MADVDVAERVGLNPLAAAVASIMVHVDFDDHSDHRVRIAAEFASRLDAVLIGVAGWVPGRESGWFAEELERDEDRLNRILAELDRLADRFRASVRRTVRNTEWRASFHFPREVIVAEARAADLLVIGSHSASEDAYRAFIPAWFYSAPAGQCWSFQMA